MSEAFEREEVTGDMALKSGGNPLGKTIDRKGGRNCDCDNPFLSSESDICSLLHFGCFSSEKNKLSSVISKHFWIFSFEFFSGVVQEWSQGRDVNGNLFFLGITTVYLSLIPKKLSNTKIYAEPTVTFCP